MTEHRYNQCPECSKHVSECVCADTPINTMDFQYLEDNAWKTIKRETVLAYRAEGLKAFDEDLAAYAKEVGAPREVVSIYKWAMEVLKIAPLYFWIIPSSSTGKYHPPFSQGEQGLVKHVLAVTYYANQFSRTFGLNTIDTACATAAAVVHDLCKYGLAYDPRYFGVHECLVRVKLGRKESGLDKDLPKEWLDKILAAVETHNGNMATGEWTAFRMPPQSDIARVLHMADYTTSRKKFHYDV